MIALLSELGNGGLVTFRNSGPLPALPEPLPPRDQLAEQFDRPGSLGSQARGRIAPATPCWPARTPSAPYAAMSGYSMKSSTGPVPGPGTVRRNSLNPDGMNGLAN